MLQKMKKEELHGDIVQIILEHHKPLKKLIKTMKDADAPLPEVRSAFMEFAPLLLNHAKPEEEVLYAAMKEAKEDVRVEAYEGETEHSMAEQLIGEIKKIDNKSEWRAKVKVLAEAVEHHIAEEEETVFKNVRKVFAAEKRTALGAEYSNLYKNLEGKFQAVA